MPGDVTVQLNHVVPDAKHHNFFMRNRTSEDPPSHSGARVPVETIVHNGRQANLKLNEAAFELFQHSTSLATNDFYTSEKVTSLYYAEIKELFKKIFGSEHVCIFHHQVRSKDECSNRMLEDGSITTNTPVQPYATNAIHTDSSCFHAEQLFQSMVSRMPTECCRGRFLYVNAWRNISDEPIEDNHLAVLDERTLVKPDDYIQMDLFAVGYDVLQYNLSMRNASQHKWYYYPKMTKEEVLVFKQWDSDPSQSGRMCFHTAFDNPSAPAGIANRQSIEVRAYVFLPDHEPNTCPLIADNVEVSAKEGATNVMNALMYCVGNKDTCLMIVHHMQGMYKKGGAKAIIEEFAEDKKGHLGLKSASADIKAQAVTLVLERGGAKHVDAIFAGTSAKFQWKKMYESRLLAAGVGAISALIVSALVT